MKKFWLVIVVIALASLLAPAVAIAQTNSAVVLDRVDNIVKVFYVTGGWHDILLAPDSRNEHRTVVASTWAKAVADKNDIGGYLSQRVYAPTKIFSTPNQTNYAEVVRTDKVTVEVRIYISNLDVFAGSTTRKYVGNFNGRPRYQMETVEVLK